MATEVHISSDTEQKKVRVSQGYALVIEPFPSMATVLQEIGWKVDAFHPRSLIEANAQQIGGFIRGENTILFGFAIHGNA